MDTAEEKTIVAVAAESREFRGLLRLAGSSRRLGWGLQFARETRIHGRKWILVADGPGAQLARNAAQAALDRTAGSVAVLSAGFCGALDPSVARNAILVADEVWDGGSGNRTPALPVFSDAAAIRGVLLSQDRVAVTADEKRQLRGHGPVAVEMEAAGVAEAALSRHLPFFCVRVVTDGANEDMVLDFNLFKDRAGRFSRWRITGAILLHPSQMRRLLQFSAACSRAARHLGEFLVDCRF